MQYRLPPLNALRAFEAAARHLSFKHAAEELSVTPTAVSHQIEVLELQARIKSGEAKLTAGLLMFLSSWLFEHIVEFDKTLEKAIRNAKRSA